MEHMPEQFAKSIAKVIEAKRAGHFQVVKGCPDEGSFESCLGNREKCWLMFLAKRHDCCHTGPNAAERLGATLKIVVDIGVSGLYEIFDEANNFFQLVALDQMRDWRTVAYGL